jgi:hypothetical protein
MLVQEYEVCLSIQRGLLDRVTSNLRCVSFVLGKDMVNMYFFYENKPSEIEKELIGDISAEVIADFPESYKICCELIEVKYPKKINTQGRVVFHRFENL